MSIAEFSSLLKDQAYKAWFKSSNTNVLNTPVTKLREYEESSSKTDFIISNSTVSDVIEKLTNKKATEEQITAVLQKLKATKPKKLIEIHESGDEVTLKFARVNLRQIGDILNSGFKEEIDSSGSNISEYFQRGHVVGVATNLVKQTKFGVQQSRLTSEQKALLLDMLDEYIAVLYKDDIATSNIKNPEHKLYAKYTKNYRRYLVELQPKTINQDSGRSVVPITASLRKYFSPDSYVLLSESKLLKDSNQFFSKLISSKGSPSLVDLLTTEIVNKLESKNIPSKEYNVPLTEIYSKKINIKAVSTNSAIKKEIASAKSLRNSISATTPKIRTVKGQFYSLASLQVLINSMLPHVIAANMGNGNDKRVLNYRTGRFAGSAQVERLTQSREGMITAFYQYQKNPYQTFEPGFKQGSPRTRDPKLLIAQSIKDIAATKVANRMRAVLV